MPVLGIGGLFFRANVPEALSSWYAEHLGIGAGCAAEGTGDPEEWVWKTQGGPVVFAPFPQDSDYFAPDKAWMLNLRVSEIDAMLDRLRGAGIEVITNPEWDQPGAGRFARLHAPEGNPIELWQPPAA